MHMAGEQRIAASRQLVWETQFDPDALKQCIPGCQCLEREADACLSCNRMTKKQSADKLWMVEEG
ncbi:MAG: SRPBCC domain-containing protein [Paracoccaceae bacterium]